MRGKIALDILYTDKYCGDFEKDEHCPQLLMNGVGGKFKCRPFDIKLQIVEFEGLDSILRCKKCLEQTK